MNKKDIFVDLSPLQFLTLSYLGLFSSFLRRIIVAKKV